MRPRITKITEGGQKKSERAKKRTKAPMINCEQCGKNIQQGHYENHIKKKHKDINKITTNTNELDAKLLESNMAIKKRKNKNKYLTTNTIKEAYILKKFNTKWENEFQKIALKFIEEGNTGWNFSKISGYLANQDIQKEYKNQSDDILNEILYKYGYYFFNEGDISKPTYKIDIVKFTNDYLGDKISHDKKIEINSSVLWTEIQREIEDEIYVANKNIQKLDIEITKCQLIKSVYFYECKILSEISDDILVPEGVKIQLKNINNDSGGRSTVISIDENSGLMYVQSSTLFKNGEYHATYSTAWLLELLKENLREKSLRKIIEKGLIWKIINSTVKDSYSLRKGKYEFTQGELNDSQINAIKYSLSSKITFIWGPPGTGKSTAIGHICKYFYDKGERTLISTISNVALDCVLLKFLKIIESSENFSEQIDGKVIRIGKTYSKEVLGKSYLYQINDAINELREKIKENTELIDELASSNNKNEEEIAKLKSIREQDVHDLKNELKDIYNRATLIFSTGSYTLIDSVVKDMKFDNVIIDEISMMNIPFLLWLSKFSNKRIIVAGDFRQLGPISSSNRPNSKMWMKRDVFNLLNKEYKFEDVSFVRMLKDQYRMHAQISELINNEFYNNQLKTKTTIAVATKCTSFQNEDVVSIINLKKDSNFQFTKSKSRINLKTQDYILSLLKSMHEDFNEPCHIGIITPYRAQAKCLIKKIEDFNSHHVIKAGTIHTFQGSEADMIILDLVDTAVDVENKKSKISRLYFEQEGERLINVALSRAKSKIIIIGDLEHIKTSCNNLTSIKFKNVINNILKFKGDD